MSSAIEWCFGVAQFDNEDGRVSVSFGSWVAVDKMSMSVKDPRARQVRKAHLLAAIDVLQHFRSML
jgi:hypothetical protein